MATPGSVSGGAGGDHPRATLPLTDPLGSQALRGLSGKEFRVPGSVQKTTFTNSAVPRSPFLRFYHPHAAADGSARLLSKRDSG